MISNEDVELHGPTSGSSNISGNHRQSVSPQSSDRLLLWQWHLATPDYDLLINSVATSAYRIMTRVKRLDKVRNTTVLASVFRQHLIHTLQAWQQKFIGHLVRSENSTYALYQPLHGNIRWGQARNNYILYIRQRTECDTDELWLQQECA